MAASTACYYSYPHRLPHFVNYVSRNLQQNTYELHTSLDLEVSELAEAFLRQALQQAKNSRISNGALLLLDNNDGSVITWLGNDDFYNQESNGQIDGVLVTNQPGSSMKPFLYALALENKIFHYL